MEGMFSLLGGRTEPLRDVEERTDGDLKSAQSGFESQWGHCVNKAQKWFWSEPTALTGGDGLAAVKASGAVYAVDNGLSDSPCQIRFRRVRIERTMEESAGLTRLRKGAGDESEGGRLPGGQGHDYRTA
jgi:hypothetical protein